MIEIANLRFSGLFDGFLSMYGARISRMSAKPGSVTPATMGWNIVSSSCRPRKYHGALDGFGVALKSASSSSGAFTKIEKISKNAVTASAATNSTTSRCGHDVDLVDRRRLDVLDRTRLDHREQPLGVTTGAGWRVWCRSSYGTTCCGSCCGAAASTAVRRKHCERLWPGQGGVVGSSKQQPLVLASVQQRRPRCSRSRVAARCSGAFLGLFGSFEEMLGDFSHGLRLSLRADH